MAWRKPGILRNLKTALLPSGLQPRTILTGPFKGIRMELDLQNESQVYAGLCEREVFPALGLLSKDVRSIVDIGAAQGQYTLYALLKTSAERVIAIEPDPVMIEKFDRNLKLNAVEGNPRLELCTKFIGTADGDNMIAADRLADWIQPPCFIKMDIEGAEDAVLHACAQSILPRPGLRWLIETHSHALREECESILKSSGYQTTYIPQAWWRTYIPELRGMQVGWLMATK
jgi:predicted RNA methylase